MNVPCPYCENGNVTIRAITVPTVLHRCEACHTLMTTHFAIGRLEVRLHESRSYLAFHRSLTDIPMSHEGYAASVHALEMTINRLLDALDEWYAVERAEYGPDPDTDPEDYDDDEFDDDPVDDEDDEDEDEYEDEDEPDYPQQEACRFGVGLIGH